MWHKSGNLIWLVTRKTLIDFVFSNQKSVALFFNAMSGYCVDIIFKF